jgi:polyisoprenoid-binding protein YceI
MFLRHLQSRTIRILVLLAVGGHCLSFPSALLAAEQVAANKTFNVDVDASRIFVKVGSATRLGHPHGVDGRLKSGHLTFGGGTGAEGSGELVFDMGTFTADTTEARKRTGLDGEKVSASDAKKVTDEMRGQAVLDVARHPGATFGAIVIKPIDAQAAGGSPGYYLLEGNFLLHGTERKIQLKARLEPGQKPGQSRLTGSFTIKQTDYGIKPFSALGGLAKVADELEISGDLVLSPAEK